MSRAATFRRVVELSDGKLVAVDPGDGWPGIAELTEPEGPRRLALHVGAVGLSHRGRDDSERRFQNPGRNRPMATEAEPMPLLVGLWEEGANPVLVGFDPTFRAQRATRQSLFIPLQMLEEAAESGWSEHTSTSGELLVAFKPSRIAEYCRFLTSAPRRSAEQSTGDTNVSPDGSAMSWLDTLAELLGVDGDRGVAKKASEALGEASADRDALELLLEVAQKFEIEWDRAAPPGPNVVSQVAAALDPRVAAMIPIWSYVGRAEAFPLSHKVLLQRIHEDKRFAGSPPPEEFEQLILDVMRACDESIEDGDLDEFLGDGIPTVFCYQMVQSHLEAVEEEATKEGEGTPVAAPEEADDAGEEDEDDAETAGPVRSQVKTFSVKNLFDLIEANRLDLQPPWQRKDVWPRKKKRELIRSLLLGIPLPSIILHKRGQQISIIDGKQRLTAIASFMRNDFKLPDFAVPEGHPLFECRGAWYEKPRARSLSPEVRTDFEFREVPALLFEDVPEGRLRQIFHLYNVSGTRLNAAEIRNAVYQSNPIHQMLYVLAGEAHPAVDLGLGNFEAQKAFTARLCGMLPSTARYAAIDFLCRYLGYSRAAQKVEGRPFSPPSTSTAINLFFDHVSGREDPRAVANEIMSVFEAAERFFDIDDEHLPFHLRDENGNRKFNRLVATTSLIGGRFLHDLLAAGLVSEAAGVKAAAEVAVTCPENQQRSTIWDYQARVLLGLRDALGFAEDDLPPGYWRAFFAKMEYARLPQDQE